MSDPRFCEAAVYRKERGVIYAHYGLGSRATSEMTGGHMTDVITKVGEYTIGEKDNKAVVEASCHEGSSAVGYIDQPNGKVWAMWHTPSGRCLWPQAGNRNFHIVGPYVPARKRAEGWVYRSSINNEANHPAYPDDPVVQVREIAPAAEKEARRKIEHVINHVSAVGYGSCAAHLYDALSLLLPDEARG